MRTVMTLFRNLEDVTFVVHGGSYRHRWLMKKMKNVKEALEKYMERHAK